MHAIEHKTKMNIIYYYLSISFELRSRKTNEIIFNSFIGKRFISFENPSNFEIERYKRNRLFEIHLEAKRKRHFLTDSVWLPLIDSACYKQRAVPLTTFLIVIFRRLKQHTPKKKTKMLLLLLLLLVQDPIFNLCVH